MQEPTKRTSTTLNLLPLYNEGASMNTPAHAVKYTNRKQEDVSHREACTSPLKYGNPAAANPMILRTAHPTAAGMDRAVNKRTRFFDRQTV